MRALRAPGLTYDFRHFCLPSAATGIKAKIMPTQSCFGLATSGSSLPVLDFRSWNNRRFFFLPLQPDWFNHFPLSQADMNSSDLLVERLEPPLLSEQDLEIRKSGQLLSPSLLFERQATDRSFPTLQIPKELFSVPPILFVTSPVYWFFKLGYFGTTHKPLLGDIRLTLGPYSTPDRVSSFI